MMYPIPQGAINELVTLLGQHSPAEIQAAQQKVLCGATNRDGSTCRTPIRGGKCPTHSLDQKQLAKRNRKVARAFRNNDPEAFRQQRSSAGKLGFQATGAMHGFAKACGKAREYRIKHPSICEQWAMSVLDNAGIMTFEREFAPEGDEVRAVDFRIGNAIIEINHPSADKRAWLERLGYTVLCVEVTEKDVLDNTEHARRVAQTIIEFVKQQTENQISARVIFDELPF